MADSSLLFPQEEQIPRAMRQRFGMTMWKGARVGDIFKEVALRPHQQKNTRSPGGRVSGR